MKKTLILDSSLTPRAKYTIKTTHALTHNVVDSVPSCNTATELHTKLVDTGMIKLTARDMYIRKLTAK